jgi:hypothetical protein
MQRLLAVVAANPAADGAGLIAMVCFIAWPLFQARSMMLIACIGNNLCFALHYALLGHRTAAAMSGLMSVQTVVAIVLVHQPRLRWMYYALTPVLALASVVTWQGAPSLIAVAATTLSTIGRMQTNDVILRVLLLAGSVRRFRWTQGSISHLMLCKFLKQDWTGGCKYLKILTWDSPYLFDRP